MKYYFLLIVIIICSCNSTPEEMIGSELIKWTENPENGFRKSIVNNSIEYIIQKRPIDYIIALEFKEDFPEAELVNQRRNELQGMEYYSLRLQTISKKSDVMTFGISSTEEYMNRNMYYSYTFQDDIKYYNGEDTLSCGLYNFVNTNGLAPYVEFVFAFDQTKKMNKDTKIIITDKVLAQQNLVFDFENIKSPKIITQ